MMSNFEILGAESPEQTKKNNQIMKQIQELKQENEDLNQVINGLTRNIREKAPYIELGVELQSKVKFISKHCLHLSSKILKYQEEHRRLKEENQALNKEVSHLTATLQKNAPLIEEGKLLQTKIKSLSLSSLHTASIIMNLKDKLEGSTSLKTNTSVELNNDNEDLVRQLQEVKEQLQLMTKMKESLDEELWISRQMQSQMQGKLSNYTEEIAKLSHKLEVIHEQQTEDLSSLELKLKHSQEKVNNYECTKELFKLSIKKLQASIHDYQKQLQQKNRQIEDLKRNIHKLQKQNKLLGEYKEQLRIATDWKLTDKYVQKIKSDFSIQYQVNLPQLQQRLKELEQEHRHYDLLFENERNVIAVQRSQLQRKETQLVLLESKLNQKQKQIEESNSAREKMFQKRQQSLQEEYHAKVKSIKEFNSCQECIQVKQKYGQTVNQLRKQLEKLSRGDLQKSLTINQLRQTLKEYATKTFQQLLEKEIMKGVTKGVKKGALKKELESRQKEIVQIIEKKIDGIQKSLNQQ